MRRSRTKSTLTISDILTIGIWILWIGSMTLAVIAEIAYGGYLAR